ncbi:flagellar basal-body MS-ring/collar protein FliF [Desulfonatronovibrio hydrogenovorans]|uniref:flagellar basal-body MS-ring/collar protein FliF n=1 Tax=Desulfonatronovibrio hydrogenovorans TaxID=53245 RepID=UPI00048F7217|nr:flagellar basal-body MS-ring/collar protein FliF [Desulfonatronovibrio hydrogenovorans]
MPPFLDNITAKVTSVWTGSSLPQKILMAGLGASVILTFILLMFFLARPDYQVLYANLHTEDASRVMNILDREGSRYRLTDGGTTVMVPKDDVHRLRLVVAGEGVLHGSGIGFELFDESRIGQTDFVQRINYQRALQGELSRTIAEFEEVEQARVHLVLPSRSLFIEEQTPPSASIVLQLRSGRTLDSRQVQSIVNLITTGVEGMDPDRVTISDTRGRVLYQPRADTLEGLSSTQLEYQLAFQQNLERRIEHMLTPITGPGRVIAKVNADLDFNRRTIRKELFDPDSSVVRSEQRSEEQSRGETHMEAGVPEAPFHGDGYTGPATSQETSRETRTTNFEISREEQNIIGSVGDVSRLNVAVLVDGKYVPNEAGEMVYEALSQEEMERIRQLVERAVGFDNARGDNIEVSNISFGIPDPEPTPTFMDTMGDYFQTIGKPLLNALLVLLFLLLVVRPIVMAILKPKVAEEDEEMAGLPQGEEREAIGASMSEEELEGMQAQKRIEDIKAFAAQLVEENFDQAFAVVKKWLKEEKA